MSSDHLAVILASCLIRDARDTLPHHPGKRWPVRDVARIDGLVVHQSMGTTTAEATARYHIGPNHLSADGLPGLSYTFFIERSGAILLANDISAKTTSQGSQDSHRDENARLLSVCVGGNFSAGGYKTHQEPTQAQMHALIDLWSMLKTVFGFANTGLHSHADFGKRHCPGDTLEAIVDAIRMDPMGAELATGGLDLSEVSERQRALCELGYYGGPADAIWGSQSRRALMHFQTESHIRVDGIFGPQTEAALRIALSSRE